MWRSSAVVILVCLCFEAWGCQSYHPVVVEVVDGETGGAVPGAVVEADYMTGLNLADLVGLGDIRPSVTTADERGRAVVELSDRQAYSRGAKAVARGYLPGSGWISEVDFAEVRRAWWRRVGPGEGVGVRVRLYREPAPAYVLVVPDGYRGVIRLDHHAPCPERRLGPGERLVEVVVRPAEGQGLPWCRFSGGEWVEIKQWQYRARYADGTPIPQAVPSSAFPEQVALRSGRWLDGRELWVVGTEAERRAVEERARASPEEFERVWKGEGVGTGGSGTDVMVGSGG